MKSNFPRIGLAKLCGWFGISRQAYYQYNWQVISTTVEEEIILHQVRQIRANHRRMGTRKLYELLQPFLLEHQIKIGRDALFDLLSANHLLVRKRKRKIKTTNSYHHFRKYSNLIRGFIPSQINQLWVCDITYWKIKNDHLYISLITDAYSHKIMGYHAGETLEANESISALQMALSRLDRECPCRPIHHSDRGVQYCSQSYVEILKNNQIKISMTENGDPLENAIAERINGIIKDEYLDNYEVDNIKQARTLLAKSVELYNSERPHLSLGNFTPNAIHQTQTELKPEKLWKTYYRKNTTLVKPDQD
jgi:transposase InsO family protein